VFIYYDLEVKVEECGGKSDFEYYCKSNFGYSITVFNAIPNVN